MSPSQVRSCKASTGGNDQLETLCRYSICHAWHSDTVHSPERSLSAGMRHPTVISEGMACIFPEINWFGRRQGVHAPSRFRHVESSKIAVRDPSSGKSNLKVMVYPFFITEHSPRFNTAWSSNIYCSLLKVKTTRPWFASALSLQWSAPS